MKTPAPWLAAGVAVVLTAACAPADSRVTPSPAEPMRPVAVTVDDAADDDTTTRVQTSLLEDPLVKGFRINVETRDGVVYLTGTVDDEKEWAQVMKLAQQTTGVKRVEAFLAVGKG